MILDAYSEKYLQLRHITQHYGSIQQELAAYMDDKSLKKIQYALNFVIQRNIKYTTQNDRTELTSLINTAIIVIKEIKLGIDSSIAALLYRTLLDQACTIEDIRQHFDSEVNDIVEALCRHYNTAITKVSIDSYQNDQDDIDICKNSTKAALIGLANNLYTMQKLAKNNRIEEKLSILIAEANCFYIPLAHRLRFYYIKGALEDICFRFQYPLEYYAIASKLKESQISRNVSVKKFSNMLEASLKKHGITCKIRARAKSIYSIWSKQTKLKIQFNDIQDLLAVRIIITHDIKKRQDEYVTCWEVYHIIATSYTPKVAKMRDWISSPKNSGYEALHTTIIDKEGRVVEIQIRTQRMDDIAEKGEAAHWKYKDL